MLEVKIDGWQKGIRFSSAHTTPELGKCERLHGHRYVVEAGLAFEQLGEGGMAYDFGDAKRVLRAVTDELDHQNLNDLPHFRERETSAENQARFIYEQMKERLDAVAGNLLYVKVWETPNQWALYSEKTLFF